MKSKFVQVAKTSLLTLLVLLLFVTVAMAVASRGAQVSSIDMPNDDYWEKHWKEYERAMLSACYSGVSLPSEKLCEWEVITQRGNTIYVWAFCADVEGRGRSGPLAIYIKSSGEVERAVCTRVFDDYKTLFPGELFDEVRNYRNRFDLNRAWSHLELRFQNPTLPPLIVVDGTPLP